jgi:hypothetical protein
MNEPGTVSFVHEPAKPRGFCRELPTGSGLGGPRFIRYSRHNHVNQKNQTLQLFWAAATPLAAT